ncbi:MAG: hypothetical protein ACHQ6T_03530 [Myxococcota bacterium]
MTRRGALGTLLLLVAGCASPPDSGFAEYASIPPGQSRLYVYRAAGAPGPRDAGGVDVDHRPLSSLEKGQYVSVVLPPGRVEVVAGVTSGTPLVRLPAREVELAADRATYCSVSARLDGLAVLWDLDCGRDPDQHAELRACRRGKLDRTVDWQP